MNHNGEKIINAENMNVDATLEKLSNELKPGETLILDVENNYFEQTDIIFLFVRKNDIIYILINLSN